MLLETANIRETSKKNSRFFEEEANKLGIIVRHSSGYNSSSQSHVEGCVGQLKTLLKKCGPLNQLQIHELVYYKLQGAKQWDGLSHSQVFGEKL